MFAPVIRWLTRSWTARTIIGLVLLVAFFYWEEDWRGRRAWEACRRQLITRGEKIDWSEFLPKPVPAADNIYEATNIARWFVGRGGGALGAVINASTLDSFVQQNGIHVLAQVDVVPPNAIPNLTNIDLALFYDSLSVSLLESPSDGSWTNPAPTTPAAGPDEKIPIIILDDVPLEIAITNLIRQAGLHCEIEPKILTDLRGTGGSKSRPRTVSARWADISARKALGALLENYNLQLVYDPRSDRGMIVSANSSGRRIYTEPSTRASINGKLRSALAWVPADGRLRLLESPQMFKLMAPPVSTSLPLRIVIASEAHLNETTVGKIIGNEAAAWGLPEGCQLKAEPSTSNSFSVVLNKTYSAPDFLAWSDQFQPQLADIRSALKRPYAGMPGDYQDPISMPIPNFIALRTTAQMLGARAQCHFLLTEPEKALEDLTLMLHLKKFLQAKPEGKPMTLVAAMINVAISGLCVSVVADGLHLGVWREPELAVLQQELAEIDLLPEVAKAFQTERASVCHLLDTVTLSTLNQRIRAMSGPNARLSPQELLEDLRALLAPKGWTYQNMTAIASMEQWTLDGFDRTGRTIHPPTVDEANRNVQATMEETSAYTFVAAQVMANTVRATITMSRNEDQARMGVIACALERHKIEKGSYPNELKALIPKFVAELPRDVINGQPFRYRLNPDGNYLLYSVGWDERDEGGVVDAGSNKGKRMEEGDWVWPNSPK
jgi:hypothetical protein